MKAPLVSVVMPTFNSAQFLPESISAVLSQTYPHVELIIVDDGSTDATAAVIEQFADSITYLRQDNFGGPSRPRNIGISKANGEFVAFCDSDDVMLPTAIADAMRVFTDLDEIDFTWGDYQIINEHGLVLKTNGMSRHQDFREDLQPSVLDDAYTMKQGTMYGRLLRGLFVGSFIVVRKSVLLDVGPFNESLLNSDDREMWLRIARHQYCFAYLDQIQFSYRKHACSVTNRGYLRMPSVISNLESQLPYLEPGADLDFVRSRINDCRLGYAWGLRNHGQLVDAERAFRQALSDSWTWRGLKGLLLTKILFFRKLFLRK